MVSLGTVGVGKVAAGAAVLAAIGGGAYVTLRDSPVQPAVIDDTAAEAEGGDASTDGGTQQDDAAATAAEPDQSAETTGDAASDVDDDAPGAGNEPDDEPSRVEVEFVAVVSDETRVTLVDDGAAIDIVHLLASGSAWSGDRCVVMMVRESPQQITGFRNGTTAAACSPAEMGATTWYELDEVSVAVTSMEEPAARILTHAELTRLLGDGRTQEVAFAEVINGGGDPPTQPAQRTAQPVTLGTAHLFVAEGTSYLARIR